MRKVTIEDISRDTGLSRGTVSRALNDRPDISTQTRQRVLEACRKLNYVPSYAARSLATGRNYAVAVLADNLRSAFTASFLRGVISRAQQSHYAVHVIEPGPNPPPEQLAAFSPERIDAVLNAIPLDAPRASKLRRSMEDRVLISCWPFDGATCDVLTPDQAEAGRLVARFLVRNGLREILYVHRPTRSGAVERLNGFLEICRENAIDPEAVTATITDLSTLDALAPRLERAQAVVATDDFLAITLMLLCAHLARRPGEDLAVIGHGNETAAAEMHPTLTTIDFAGEEIGRRSMETALQRLGGERSDAPEHIRIAPLLVQRASTRHLGNAR
jgi:DNA-binding LacI/PurR family transcriptional regulator